MGRFEGQGHLAGGLILSPGYWKQADQFVLLECPSGFRGGRGLQEGGSIEL